MEFVTANKQKNKRSVEIVNIDWKYLHIFWTAWGIPMKSSGNLSIKIKLIPPPPPPSKKKTGFHPLSRRYIFGKTTKEGRGANWLPSLLRVKKLIWKVDYLLLVFMTYSCFLLRSWENKKFKWSLSPKVTFSLKFIMVAVCKIYKE